MLYQLCIRTQLLLSIRLYIPVNNFESIEAPKIQFTFFRSLKYVQTEHCSWFLLGSVEFTYNFKKHLVRAKLTKSVSASTINVEMKTIYQFFQNSSVTLFHAQEFRLCKYAEMNKLLIFKNFFWLIIFRSSPTFFHFRKISGLFQNCFI